MWKIKFTKIIICYQFFFENYWKKPESDLKTKKMDILRKIFGLNENEKDKEKE